MMRAVHLTALTAALAGRAGHRRAGWLAAAALANVGGARLMWPVGLLPLPRLAPPPSAVGHRLDQHPVPRRDLAVDRARRDVADRVDR